VLVFAVCPPESPHDVTPSAPPLPPSGAALLRGGERDESAQGERWLQATAEARRLTLELRRQLQLGERLLWACRHGDRILVHVSDPAAAAAARFAAAAFLRRAEGGSSPRLVVRLGPPCPARLESEGPGNAPRLPEGPLAQLLERVRRIEDARASPEGRARRLTPRA